MTAKTFGMAGVALAMVLGTIACGPAPHNGSDAGTDAGCTGSACKSDGGCVGSSCTKTVYEATYTLPAGEDPVGSFSIVTNVNVDSTTGVVTSTAETIADCLNDHACGVAFADGQDTCENTTSCTIKTTSKDQVDLQPTPDGQRLFPWQHLHPSDPPAAAVTPTAYSDIVIGSEQDPVAYLVNNAVTYHLYTAVVTLSADGTTLPQPVVALCSNADAGFYTAEPPSVKKGAPMVRMSFILNWKDLNATPPTHAMWKGTFTSDGSLFTGPMDYGDGTGTYTDTGVRQ